ncbi:MAG TPA: hypothetical protein P5084_07700 [Paludibacter sp.]|nr:hypothetical protein [Paludibacter sp.]
MYKNKFFLLAFFFIIVIQSSNSQNNTNSPYTRFGYGDLSDSNSGEQRAMGGISIGSRSKYGINPVNPASYSVVDSMTFMFDVALGGLVSKFTDNTGNKTSFTSNLEYITMLFPLSKKIGFSAGLLPYSFSGYNFYNTDTILVDNHTAIPDSIGYNSSFYGNGGISQVYTGISFNLFNHISLGANAYYMFGNLSNYRSLTFNANSGYYSTSQRNAITVNNFRLRYGAQFYNTFAKKHDVNLGLIYEHKATLNGNFSQITSGVLTDSLLPDTDFQLPTTMGAGLHYTFDKRLTLGVDYTLQKWGDAKFFGKTDSLSNRSKFAIGAEYIPDPRGRKYYERMRFRTGLNISNPYYKVAGITPPKNFGITFGIGLPLKNSNTIVNATVEYGKVGATNMLREDYLKFTFNAAFNENWFFKRKL